MGRQRDYQLGLYIQFEELNKKLDLLLKENKELKSNSKKEIIKATKVFKEEISELKETIKILTKKLEEANKLNQKLQEEIDRLKNKNNKNSTNSSKPSSTNITTPKNKTGANLYNYRTKTNKKIGGQFGHKGTNLSKTYIEDLIADKKLEVKEIIHYIKGTNNQKDIVKYRIELETKAYVEKHIFKHTKTSKNKLPKEYYTDVTYGNSIKALSIQLGTYNIISYDRLSDFFSVVTNNVINISNGTLVNFLYEFSKKSNQTINILTQDILDSRNIFTDETGTKFNKKNMYVRNYSNENTVIYKAHKNKGHNPIKEDNILTNFCGGIMGDHDTALYSYGTKNYECNIHLGRYLEELIQNIYEISWAKEMKNFIFRIKNTKEIAMSFNLNKFDDKKIEEYEKEFDYILEKAIEENKNIKSSFYKDKANQLFRRLKKYKINHLHFIKNFEVAFDNNMSERDLRIFKTKTKVSGGFRSLTGAEHFVNALSIIKTSIKRKLNPFDSIKSIFNNEVLFIK